MVYIRVTPHFVEWLQFWKDVESCIKWFYRTPGICPGDFYVLLHWPHVTRHEDSLSCIYDAFKHKLLQITISMVGLILRATTLFIEGGGGGGGVVGVTGLIVRYILNSPG